MADTESHSDGQEIEKARVELAQTQGRQRITEDWLRANGFRWHQLERQPYKQWLLWLGDAMRDPEEMFHCFEDFGIELTMCGILAEKPEEKWHCWVRADVSMRYSRFLHVRYLRFVDELIHLIEGLTGQKWDPANNMYGSMMKPEQARRNRAHELRLDRQMIIDRPKWSKTEEDETRGRALPEHLESHAKSRGEI